MPGGSYESYTRLDIALKGNNASSDYNTDVTVLTMQNNGNIGIGTVTPNDKFSVYNRFLINHDGVAKWGGSADYGFLSWDNGRAMIGGQTGQGLALYTDNSEKIRILTNGNVGIGTTNPQNTLDVNGIIRAREIKATLEGWSDFVFDDGYKLPSLSEVENYIKANRQLLDIPSTKDISKDGVNLGEMQTKLLQKIEELTLYAIEQNRRIELLEQEIENLNRK